MKIKIKNRYISISGLDDILGGKPNFENTFKGHNIDSRNFILVQCPIYFKTINKSSLVKENDLVLSVFTPGGKIKFLGFFPFKPAGTSNYLKS